MKQTKPNILHCLFIYLFSLIIALIILIIYFSLTRASSTVELFAVSISYPPSPDRFL